MNRLWTYTALLRLSAGLAVAGGLTETNQMPTPLHGLMDASGHVLAPTNLVLRPPDSNSLRSLPPIKPSRLMVFQQPVPKPRWSFWNNASLKYVGRNHDPLNAFAPAQLTPYSALAQFEYDITFSFDF